MKTYDETVDRVFTRIRENERTQKKRRKALAIGASATVIVAAAVIAIGIVPGITERDVRPPTQDDNAVLKAQDSMTGNDFQPAAGVSDPAGEPDRNSTLCPGVVSPNTGETDSIASSSAEQNASAESPVSLTKTDNLPQTRAMLWALHTDDSVPMDAEGIEEYYGFRIDPALPEDLTARESNPRIYRRDGGSGEIYWDLNSFTFENADQSRGITVSLTREFGSSVFDLWNIFPDPSASTVLNGIPVYFGVTESEEYFAYFTLGRSEVFAFSFGLDLDEFFTAVNSLIG